MILFCHHDWEVVKDETTESKYEHARKNSLELAVGAAINIVSLERKKLLF